MQPKISIITPVYNGGHCIQDCIKSVLDQTYPHKEHIVIDGLSKDDTMEIVKSYSKEKSLQFISEKDNGIYDAMNKGIELATGDYLFFLGADDMFYNNTVLEDIYGMEENYVGIDFLYGKSLYTTSNIVYGKEVVLNDLKQFQLNHQSIFYKSLVFKKLGTFDIKYKICADAIFNIRCFKDERFKKKFIDIVVSHFNDTGLSNSNARDLDYQKDYLTFFDNLSTMEALKKMYYRNKPDWFTPALWLKKLK